MSPYESTEQVPGDKTLYESTEQVPGDKTLYEGTVQTIWRERFAMKKFNTTAVCIPSKHYMVDLSERVKDIRKFVDDGKYFTINRARQYGKTTTIALLANDLKQDYAVLSLDFQKISDASFKSEEKFVQAFSRQVLGRGRKLPIPDPVKEELQEFISRKEDKALFDELFAALSEWCKTSEKPVVMMIDEVDTATNNQVFLDFLAQLRADYLEREDDPDEKTFQSVILAGVTDVKHLRLKIRPEDEHKVNSPWNIASDFDIDMSLSEDGIKGMLEEYEADHHTGMDTAAIAHSIREYTNGYPFLVSRICQLIDEEVSRSMEQAEAGANHGAGEDVSRTMTAEPGQTGGRDQQRPGTGGSRDRPWGGGAASHGIIESLDELWR